MRLTEVKKMSVSLYHPRSLPWVVYYSLTFPLPGSKENEIILFVCAQGRDKGIRIWGINIGRDQHRVSHAEKKILHRQNEV